MISLPAALVVGHPGHELRLHRWLEVAKPCVFVLTDGSGSGRARVDSTLEVLRMTGCEAGSIMGRFTDREIYRMIMEGDADPIVELTLELAASLVEHEIRSVVADACERYNPTHDLCSVVAGLALERARGATGRFIALYDYAVAMPTTGAGETQTLDDAAFSRKMAAAARCEELKLEVENLVRNLGLEELRREVLRPAERAPDPETLMSKPFYEVHGEQRVAAGRYDSVLRYEQHYLPFVKQLVAAISAVPAAPA